MTKHSRKYLADMMPDLITCRGCPVDDVIDFYGRDLSRLAIRAIRPNCTAQISETISTYFDHSICNAIIIIIIDNLITRVTTMVITM